MNAQAFPEPVDREKYSSAATLSDMEIFIFPELMYALVLANIMSPALWAWRDDSWFRKSDRLSPYRRVLRLKQFIIDRYEFNLDLETWGLTTQDRERRRFREYIDEKTLAASNALFGYEGDRYYFDLDIRRHFGLDKYDRDVIPYWKTETIEAMNAFRFRQGYSKGAGECVSLAALYAAALFVVCRVPLEDLFLMATPLHSQNFIDIGDGVLTNNRRLVTRNMWFNGTELTEKAQRALRHEQVTVVAHSTGFIHAVYPEATIDPEAYQRFRSRLNAFTNTVVDSGLLANFLRQNSALHPCFQVRHEIHGKPRFIELEKLFHYEHSSAFRVNDETRARLLDEIDEDAFYPEPLSGRIELDRLEDFLRGRTIEQEDTEGLQALVAELNCRHAKGPEILRRLAEFIRLEPRLPDGKTFVPGEPLRLDPGMTRNEITAHLESMRFRAPLADLSFYAFRDLSRTDWRPFLKAALERNPVCAVGLEGTDDEAAAALLQALPDDSIYGGSRAAQPDEVWNYQRGQGLEKAICLAAVLRARHPSLELELETGPEETRLSAGHRSWAFSGHPSLRARHQLPPA